MRKSVSITVSVAVSLVVCFLVLGLFFFGPPIAYHALSPSLDSECSAIRPAMSREQVLGFVHEKTSPPFEDLSSPTHLTFARGKFVCTVEFDLRTGEVIGSPVMSIGWDQDLPVGSYE